MQFLYDEKAGKEEIVLKNESFNHLKARRVKLNECINLCNLYDEFLYTYQISELTRNSCTLVLKDKAYSEIKTHKNISLALGIIEPKNVEKNLPFLNELGLDKLILVYTTFSQNNFFIDFERLKRILIHSCEQCGRTYLMKFECFDNTKSFIKAYPNCIMVDFSAQDDDFSKLNEKDILFIGAEGGFNDEEKMLFERKIKLKSPYILKSQNALLAVAAKILL